jgi:hypothetical protein
MPVWDSNATVYINTGHIAHGPPLEFFFFCQKQGLAPGARGDEGKELSCKRTEKEQFNFVPN